MNINNSSHFSGPVKSDKFIDSAMTSPKAVDSKVLTVGSLLARQDELLGLLDAQIGDLFDTASNYYTTANCPPPNPIPLEQLVKCSLCEKLENNNEKIYESLRRVRLLTGLLNESR